jgi:hypothetical protein
MTATRVHQVRCVECPWTGETRVVWHDEVTAQAAIESKHPCILDEPTCPMCKRCIETMPPDDAKRERERVAAEELLAKLEARGNLALTRPQVPGALASNTTKVELTIFELDFVLNLARYALTKDRRT